MKKSKCDYTPLKMLIILTAVCCFWSAGAFSPGGAQANDVREAEPRLKVCGARGIFWAVCSPAGSVRTGCLCKRY